MFPVPVELNPANYLVLKEIEHDLKILGFNIEFSEKNKILIKGRPAETNSSDPVEMLEILIETYKNTQAGPSSGAKEKVAVAMACASAIPYGKILINSEMEDLFDSLFACKAPNYSPNGKPVINIIPLEELDKRFK